MSANIDPIDLNPVVVSADRGNDLSKERLADGETLTASVEGMGSGRGEEAMVLDGKVGDFGEENASKECLLSDKGANLEAEIVTGEIESVCGKEGTSVVVGSSLGAGDTKVVESECLPREDADGVELDEMEIDGGEAEVSDLEKESDNVVDEAVSHGTESDDGNVVDLVADLEPFQGGDSDTNVKEAVSRKEFVVSDLVWGKVRSHPWWPGQIFKHSDASKKAQKYFKKGCYLIAYFGDQTFAWNEVSKIKPFRPHFPQMEKQSNLEEFHHALDCVLDEISRRVEYELKCSCVPEFNKVKTQVIDNPGIREESCRRDGGDRFLSAASFEPSKLIEYVRGLGQTPVGVVDRLEFVTAHAQLLAFNHWKGYSHLPELQFCDAWPESKAEVPKVEEEHGCGRKEKVSTKAEDSIAVLKHDSDDECAPSRKVKSESQVGSSHKRKHVDGDSGHSSKKEKSLAEMVAEKRLSVSSGRSKVEGKATGKLNTSPAAKKRKGAGSPSGEMVEDRKIDASSPSDNEPAQPKKATYRVGDSILRVASQLNEQTPILKAIKGASQKPSVKTKSQQKSLPQKSGGKMLFPIEDASPHEMVSQLCLVARNPMKRCNLLKSLVSFMVQFRNSISLDHLDSYLVEQSSPENVSGDDIKKESTKSETETPELATLTASICEDPASVDNLTGAEKCPLETPTKKGIPIESQSAVQLGPDMGCDQTADGVTSLEPVKSVDHWEKNDNNDSTPTALILSFKDFDSIPSEASLNKIFSRFGPLKESETEILKKNNRAKVVFRKSADAETAFSSAGKYSIFGPSLVRYSLKYVTSTPSKSSVGTKNNQKAAASLKEMQFDA